MITNGDNFIIPAPGAGFLQGFAFGGGVVYCKPPEIDIPGLPDVLI
jgi:hypothetical protein